MMNTMKQEFKLFTKSIYEYYTFLKNLYKLYKFLLIFIFSFLAEPLLIAFFTEHPNLICNQLVFYYLSLQMVVLPVYGGPMRAIVSDNCPDSQQLPRSLGSRSRKTRETQSQSSRTQSEQSRSRPSSPTHSSSQAAS